YLRDPGQPHGTLIIGWHPGQAYGYTPLGLPGQDQFTIPDAVLIQGDPTRNAGPIVTAEHVGQVIEFQNNLTIRDNGSLVVNGSALVPDVAPLITAGGLLQVTGAFAPAVTMNLAAG